MIGILNLDFVTPKEALPYAKPRHMTHPALISVQSFSLYGRTRKKVKEKEGKAQKVKQALYFIYS